MFGTVKLTKHVYVAQDKYSGYDIGFDRKISFLIDNEVRRNLIIFVVDMSPSSHIDNKKTYILILDKSPR